MEKIQMIYNLITGSKKARKDLKIRDVFYMIFLAIFLGIALSELIFKISIINTKSDYAQMKDTFYTGMLPLRIIKLCLIVPITEEIFFRGILYNAIKIFGFKEENLSIKAMLITSLIFAILHLNPMQIIYAFCLSMIIIYEYEKYKTLVIPMIIHIVNNTVTVFASFLNLSWMEKIRNSYGIYILIIVMFVFAGIIEYVSYIDKKKRPEIFYE